MNTVRNKTVLNASGARAANSNAGESKIVKVPQSILEGLEMVRESGEVNMLDRKGAQVVANKLERYDLVIWLEDNREDYAKGLFEGFEAE